MNHNTAKLIHHFLEQNALKYPDKTALIHEEVRATYAKINASANQLAHWLLDHGTANGDRIVLLLENSLEYIVSYYGLLKTGAVAVPLSTDLKPDNLGPLLDELKPEFLISSSRFERLLQATDLAQLEMKGLIVRNPKGNWSSTPISIFAWEDLFIEEDTPNPETNVDESELASIIYTSGSTGTPKGVMLSHKNLVANTHSICQYLRLTEKDIQMVVLPFFYVMGKSLLNTHMAVGGTVVINNKFAFPATVIQQMLKENVTGFSGVPSSFAHLLHRSPLEKYRDKLHSLRYCSQAGGHMSRQIKEKLRKVLPDHTEIFIMYGATEASARLTYLEPDRFLDKINSIGKPIPGVTLNILDENNQIVPNGQTGELVGNGPNIMQGYWKDDMATTRVLDQFGYHTGDQGYQDKEGFFYISGRKDSLLKVGGHRINCQEIEDILMETGLVIESAVIGIPDELLGNKLIALVSPINGNCTENQMIQSCAQKLPKYKLPGKIILVRSLPKRTSGKIDRSRCLEIAAKGN